VQENEWAQAQRWIATTLAERGLAVVGEIEISRDRPWSRVARVPVAGGHVWFKRNNAGTRYEPGLARTLGALIPHQVLIPLAVDLDRGWMLLPDGGHTLRSLTEDTFDEARWTTLLGRYAELQRAVAPHAADLLALGVPDVRAQRLPELFAGLLDDAFVAANLSAEHLAALRGWQPRIEKLSARLAASGIAPSIQHDDLHTNNVFADADGGLRFFDFGDASIAHPFGSMLVALRVVHHQTKIEHGDPLLHRLRDAYLSAWTDEHDLSELRELCQDAIVVTKISKALSYQRALVDADEPAITEYGDGIYGWLEELLGPDVI
jgi:hypothetical protein